MKRSQCVLATLLCVSILSGISFANNVSFSLNLEFNNPADFNSGGTWTVVTKADERGLAAVVLNFELGSLNFDPLTGFLTPPGFEVEQSGSFGGIRLEIVQGDNPLVSRTLDVAVIGVFPSTYVDDPSLIVFGSNPDLGSFTGGAELATGSFDPGDIPTWIAPGANPGNDTAANIYLDATSNAVEANTFVTVRYVVPEPATMLLAALSLIGLVVRRR